MSKAAERELGGRRRGWAAPAVTLLVAAATGYLLILLTGSTRRETSLESADHASVATPHAPLPAASRQQPPQVRASRVRTTNAGADRPLRRGLHPRDPHEWQGMMVNLDRQAFCETKSGCGLAMACLEGRCGPCSESGECAEGEACVLDHCLRAELVSCTSRRDCAADELCVLNGYSGGGARNNERMRSECMGLEGGVEQQDGEHASAIGPPPEALEAFLTPPSTVDLTALQDDVAAYRRERMGDLRQDDSAE
ncbi:MAG: hypothetical protein OXU20_40050 [Myxococcales bacterium]|nr:hypothetical protein [Myxococcales bacterium]